MANVILLSRHSKLHDRPANVNWLSQVLCFPPDDNSPWIFHYNALRSHSFSTPRMCWCQHLKTLGIHSPRKPGRSWLPKVI